MNKVKVHKEHILCLVVLILLLFAIFAVIEAFKVESNKKVDPIQVNIYSPMDSLYKELKIELDRMRNDIEYLKKRKSKIIINCCNSDSTIQYRE